MSRCMLKALTLMAAAITFLFWGCTRKPLQASTRKSSNVKINSKRLKAQPEPVVEEFKNSIGIVFCWIPAGSAVLGSLNNENDRDPNVEMLRTVEIKNGFWLGKYEVTRYQWTQVMGKKTLKDLPDKYRVPVAMISYDDCLSYIERLNNMEGHNRYRLPREDEWEYACRAKTRTAYYFGNELTLRETNFGACADEPWTDKHPVYGKDVFLIKNKAIDVGSYQPNAWGLFDMHGNVAEWCAEWDLRTWDQSSEIPEESIFACRIFRGGSWFDKASHCRSSFRNSAGQNIKFDTLGFRLLMEK